MFSLQHLVCVIAFCVLGTNARVVSSPLEQALQKIGDEPQMQKIFEDQILEVLEDIREIILNGNDDVPILDPFQYDEIALNVGDLLGLDQASLGMKGIVCTGLGGFNVNSLSFSLLTQRLTFDISWPELTLQVEHYDLNIADSGTTIYGSGPGKLVIKAGSLSGRVQVSIGIITGITVSSAEVVLSVGEVQSQIEGLLDGSAGGAFINNIIEQLIPELVSAYESDISEFLNVLIVELANDLLRTGNSTIFKEMVHLFPGILDAILPL